MSFEDIKAHLDRLFAYRPAGSSREQAAGLREALIEMKAALAELRVELQETDLSLAAARKDRDDTERRGRLAADIDDQETTRIAEEYLVRIGGRVDLLERKVIVQRDELAMAEREYESMRAQFQRAAHGLPSRGTTTAGPDADGSLPPDPDPFLDRRLRDAAVDAQLEHLKKKLGRE